MVEEEEEGKKGKKKKDRKEGVSLPTKIKTFHLVYFFVTLPWLSLKMRNSIFTAKLPYLIFFFSGRGFLLAQYVEVIIIKWPYKHSEHY